MSMANVNLIKTDGVIFDLDGTMWDSREQIAQAWNVMLKDVSNIHRTAPITKEELSSCMGLSMYDIAAKLFPKDSSLVRNRLMDRMCLFENEYLKIEKPPIFDGIDRVVNELHEKVSLYIVSNCQSGYIEVFLEDYGYKHLFKDIECWGNTGESKAHNINAVIKRNDIKHPVYFGDTLKDYMSAKEVGIPFIHAAYGFGTINGCEHSAKQPTQLLDFLEFF